MKNNDLNHDWMHGLYRLPTSQRQQIISDQFSLADDQQALMKENASQLGSQLIENYLTDYRLPEGVGTTWSSITRPMPCRWLPKSLPS